MYTMHNSTTLCWTLQIFFSVFKYFSAGLVPEPARQVPQNGAPEPAEGVHRRQQQRGQPRPRPRHQVRDGGGGEGEPGGGGGAGGGGGQGDEQPLAPAADRGGAPVPAPAQPATAQRWVHHCCSHWALTVKALVGAFSNGKGPFLSLNIVKITAKYRWHRWIDTNLVLV